MYPLPVYNSLCLWNMIFSSNPIKHIWIECRIFSHYWRNFKQLFSKQISCLLLSLSIWVSVSKSNKQHDLWIVLDKSISRFHEWWRMALQTPFCHLLPMSSWWKDRQAPLGIFHKDRSNSIHEWVAFMINYPINAPFLKLHIQFQNINSVGKY